MVPLIFRVTRGICPHYFLRGTLQESIIWGKSVRRRQAPALLLRSALGKRTPFWNRSKPRAPSGYRVFWTTAALCGPSRAPPDALWEKAGWPAVGPGSVTPRLSPWGVAGWGSDFRKECWVLVLPHTHCLALHPRCLLLLLLSSLLWECHSKSILLQNEWSASDPWLCSLDLKAVIHDGQGHLLEWGGGGGQSKLNTNPTSVFSWLCEISHSQSSDEKPQLPHLQNVGCDCPSESKPEAHVI